MAQNNKRNYTQSFTYDKIGNMLTKVSTESKYPNVSVSALNYTNAGSVKYFSQILKASIRDHLLMIPDLPSHIQ